MRYNAFISYKHSDTDMFVAKQVHKRLETFKIPNNVKKKFGKKKIERVFRDEEELPIGSDLGNNITAALQESEFLIVICSKESKKSYWVNQEIDTFVKLKGHKNVLAVLLDGEPDESFPELLLKDDNGNPIEPLAADVRGSNKKQIKKRIKTEIVRLAAQIIGCSYDELKQRHKERRMRKIIAATATIAILAICFGAYSIYNYLTIKKNYEAKLINQSKYLADTSMSLLEQGDRMTAGLIALEALPNANNKRPLVSSAQLALSKALYAYADGNEMLKDRLLKHDLTVVDIKYSLDGNKMVSLDVGGTVYVWDISDGKLLLKMTPTEEILGTMLSTKDEVIIVGKSGIRCVDLEGNIIWNENSEKEYIYCVFDTENDKVAGISLDLVEIWDASTGELLVEIENTDGEYVFSNTGVFDSEGKNFAVALQADSDDVDGGKVYSISLSNSKTATINVKKPYIMNMCYDSEGNILVQSRIDSYGSITQEFLDIYVEKFDSSSKKLLWDEVIEVLIQELFVSETILQTRSYSEQNDEIDEVIVSFKNTIYVYDEKNGDTFSKITVPQGIATILFSMQSSTGYVVDDSGLLHFYNLNTGELILNDGINIDRSVTKVIIKNGVLAAKIYSSPDVLIMKYYEGYGKEIIAEYEDTVYELEQSENEEVYVVICKNDSYYTELNFYDVKTDELLFKYSSEDLDYSADCFFFGDEYYCALIYSGDVLIIDIEDETVDIIEAKEKDTVYNWSLSQNEKYAVAYSQNDYFVVDFEKQDVIDNGTIGSIINACTISNDGMSAYFSCEDMNVKISLDNGKQTELSNMEFVSVCLSSDGKYLAGNCSDNKIRVYQTAEWKLVNEFDFIGQESGFIKFVDNEYHIITQGDTYYWGVFDIETNEYVYLSDVQYNYIEKIVTNDDTLVIYTDVYMLIVNKTDYEPIAEVKKGIGYLPKTNAVYTINYNAMYKFPYMDLDMLLEQAKIEFGSNTLSKLERVQYNID